MDVTRMPVMPLSEKSGNAPFIDETEFTSPENEAEQVKIYIYLASPVFINEALQVSTALNFFTNPMSLPLKITIFRGRTCDAD